MDKQENINSKEQIGNSEPINESSSKLIDDKTETLQDKENILDSSKENLEISNKDIQTGQAKDSLDIAQNNAEKIEESSLTNSDDLSDVSNVPANNIALENDIAPASCPSADNAQNLNDIASQTDVSTSPVSQIASQTDDSTLSQVQDDSIISSTLDLVSNIFLEIKKYCLEIYSHKFFFEILIAIIIISICAFVILKIRKHFKPIKLNNSSNGIVELSPKALKGLVQNICYGAGLFDKAGFAWKRKWGKLHIYLDIKITIGQNAFLMTKKLQQDLTIALKNYLGVSKLGKINIKITGFTGVSMPINQSLPSPSNVQNNYSEVQTSNKNPSINVEI